VEFILFLFLFLFLFPFLGSVSAWGGASTVLSSLLPMATFNCFSSGTHTTFMDPTHEFYCTFLLCKDIYPFRRVRLLLNKKKKKLLF
jgi:hypothetical protein